jgi:hypothetical protein
MGVALKVCIVKFTTTIVVDLFILQENSYGHIIYLFIYLLVINSKIVCIVNCRFDELLSISNVSQLLLKSSSTLLGTF